MITPQRSRGGALNSTHLLATNRKLASGSSADLKVGATSRPPASRRRAKRQLRHAPLSTRLRGRTPKAPRAQAFAMASRPCSLTGKMPVPRRVWHGHPFGKLRAASGHVCGSGGDAPVTAGRMPHHLHPWAPSRVPRHVKDRSQESGVRSQNRRTARAKCSGPPRGSPDTSPYRLSAVCQRKVNLLTAGNQRGLTAASKVQGSKLQTNESSHSAKKLRNSNSETPRRGVP